MSQNKRLLIVALVLTGLMAAFVMYNAMLSNKMSTALTTSPLPGMVSLFANGMLKAHVMPADLDRLPRVTFAEPEKEKSLEGWMLKDVIALYIDTGQISGGCEVSVLGVGEKRGEKTATLSWKEVLDPNAHVMLHPARDGQSLKLVSTLEQMDTRDEWVQGVKRIDINTRPEKP